MQLPAHTTLPKSTRWSVTQSCCRSCSAHVWKCPCFRLAKSPAKRERQYLANFKTPQTADVSLLPPPKTHRLFFGLPAPVPLSQESDTKYPSSCPSAAQSQQPPPLYPSPLTPPPWPQPRPPPDSDSDSSRSSPPSRRLPSPPSPPRHASPRAAASQTQNPPAPSDRATSPHRPHRSRRAPPRAWRIQSRRTPTPNISPHPARQPLPYREGGDKP